MGDLESLLLVLAAIYLTECMVWVRRGAVAFRGFWSRNWRLRHPEGVLANQRGAIVFANPLPPLDTVFVSAQFPVSLSADGVYSYTAASINPGWRPPQLARFVRFSDLRSVDARQKQVLINDELFLRAASTAAAWRWTKLLRELHQAPQSRREALIQKAVADSFDPQQIKTRLDEFSARAKTLRVLANLLFIFLFGIAAPLAWAYGLRHVGLYLLAGLLVQTVTIALLFRRAHLALYTDADEERFTRFLTMLLAPPTAIRAVDLLGRRLLEQFHPIAVAQVLCAPANFQRFARGALLDLRYPFIPVTPTDDAGAVRVEEWFRLEIIAAVERAARQAGLNPAKFAQPPQPTERAHRGYCPRCLAQFITTEGTCADCGGRPLLPLPPPAAKANH